MNHYYSLIEVNKTYLTRPLFRPPQQPPHGRTAAAPIPAAVRVNSAQACLAGLRSIVNARENRSDTLGATDRILREYSSRFEKVPLHGGTPIPLVPRHKTTGPRLCSVRTIWGADACCRQAIRTDPPAYAADKAAFIPAVPCGEAQQASAGALCGLSCPITPVRLLPLGRPGSHAETVSPLSTPQSLRTAPAGRPRA